MELIVIFMFIFTVVLVFKLLGAMLHVAVFALTLPFQIIGFLVSVLVFTLVALPLGLIFGAIGLFMLPVILFFKLLPFLLIGLVVYLFAKRASQT